LIHGGKIELGGNYHIKKLAFVATRGSGCGKRCTQKKLEKFAKSSK